MLFFVLKLWLWFIIAAATGALAAAFAFIKISGRPFTVFLKSAFFYFWKPRFYLWQKEVEQKPLTKGLSALELKMRTSTQAIGPREKGFRWSIFSGLRPQKEFWEAFRKKTGEMEIARRIDYR